MAAPISRSILACLTLTNRCFPGDNRALVNTHLLFQKSVKSVWTSGFWKVLTHRNIAKNLRATYFSLVWLSMFKRMLPIGGSKGGARDARPPWGPNSFIFMQFSRIKLKNNSTFGSWRTPLGKILDPPLLPVTFLWYIMVCNFK